jgi:hypothetical protein
VPVRISSKSRALDALVGAGIAAVVIVAATFGDLGPAHRAMPSITYGTMQGSVRQHFLKAKPAHAKARCSGSAPCSL